MGLSANQTKLKAAANGSYVQSVELEANAEKCLNQALTQAFAFGYTFVLDQSELFKLIQDMGAKPSRSDTSWWTDVVKACFGTTSATRKNAYDFPSVAAISKYQTILAYAHYKQWNEAALDEELSSRSATDIYREAGQCQEFVQAQGRSKSRSMDKGLLKRLDDACTHTFDGNTITLSEADLEDLLVANDDGLGAVLIRRENGRIKLWRAPLDATYIRKAINEYATIEKARKPLTEALRMRSLLPKGVQRHMRFEHEGDATMVTLFGALEGTSAIRFTTSKLDVPHAATFDEKGIDRLLGLSIGVGDERFTWEVQEGVVKIYAKDQEVMPDPEAVYKVLQEEGVDWSSPDGTERVDCWIVETVPYPPTAPKFNCEGKVEIDENVTQKLMAEGEWKGKSTTISSSNGSLHAKSSKSQLNVPIDGLPNHEPVKLLRGQVGRAIKQLEGVSTLGISEGGVIISGTHKDFSVTITIPALS
ncbi:hypothetical protein [Paramagnetospirillum magneticum]|uniref:Uncharacterized protein n=1 Tax=Paramagnetospirillum magneticum (strain ATCC 700264 / AMB-1) TaxID=342108 RepID=Q2W0Y9_PARM1|nr:hypothetical protein [Paramagnetospirillum magneticum]BAE52486.1 hypothetical protein amb3682 [Paramagnetospirillum magneticum AMB-1]